MQDSVVAWKGVTIRLLKSVGYRRNTSLRRFVEHAWVARKFRLQARGQRPPRRHSRVIPDHRTGEGRGQVWSYAPNSSASSMCATCGRISSLTSCPHRCAPSAIYSSRLSSAMRLLHFPIAPASSVFQTDIYRGHCGAPIASERTMTPSFRSATWCNRHPTRTCRRPNAGCLTLVLIHPGNCVGT